MANEYQYPYPLGTDTWIAAVHKAAILFGQMVQGQVSLPAAQSGQAIPANDEQVFSYYGATNNVANIIYKLAGVQVAQQTFEYANPGSNDANVTRVTLVLS